MVLLWVLFHYFHGYTLSAGLYYLIPIELVLQKA